MPGKFAAVHIGVSCEGLVAMVVSIYIYTLHSNHDLPMVAVRNRGGGGLGGTTPSPQPTGPRCGDGSSAGAQIYSTTSLYTASLYIYCIYISLQPPRWPLSDQCVASASSVSWRGGSWSPIVYRPTCVAYIILSAHLRPLIASDDLVTTVVS